MRLFPAALDTPLDSPFSATLSVHGLHFTVYAPSILLPRLRSSAAVMALMLSSEFFPLLGELVVLFFLRLSRNMSVLGDVNRIADVVRWCAHLMVTRSRRSL